MTRLSTLFLAFLAVPLHAEDPAPDLALGAVIVTGGRIKVSVVNRGDAASHGCYLDLALYDAAGGRADSRRQVLRPLPPGESQEVAFPAEPAFAGKRFQVTVDSSNRIKESDEGNNVSEMVEAPAAAAPPVRIPAAQKDGGGRPAPIRIGGSPAGNGGRPAPVRIPGKAEDTGTKPPPIRISGKTEDTGTKPPPIRVPGRDPAQLGTDLAAVKVSDNGIEATGVVRNDGSVAFTGKRTASLVREARGSSHVLENVTLASREVPPLEPGGSWDWKVASPPKVKGARSYVYWLVLDPSDHNAGNDSVQKTVKVVAFD
jgi:hypothetical protein